MQLIVPHSARYFRNWCSFILYASIHAFLSINSKFHKTSGSALIKVSFNPRKDWWRYFYESLQYKGSREQICFQQNKHSSGPFPPLTVLTLFHPFHFATANIWRCQPKRFGLANVFVLGILYTWTDDRKIKHCWIFKTIKVEIRKWFQTLFDILSFKCRCPLCNIKKKPLPI